MNLYIFVLISLLLKLTYSRNSVNELNTNGDRDLDDFLNDYNNEANDEDDGEYDDDFDDDIERIFSDLDDDDVNLLEMENMPVNKKSFKRDINRIDR